MNIRIPHPLAGLCVLWMIALPATASEPGNMMKMTTTTHMSMSGMPAMGPMTHSMNVCTSAQKPDPTQMMKNEKDCTVSNYRKVGDTISYHMECRGHMQMSGDGKFQILPSHGIHGSMHVDGNAGGQPMTMDMAFDGQRIGACDYTPPKPAP
ncbi:MAG TPA: DUF3617 family protein [Rhodanobacter sp.]|nr:DUF3617 family protein [Rhodanobacter sp.]